MTRTEMIEFIKENPYVHITHPLFSDYEYIYSGTDGIIYDEFGYVFETWDYFDMLRCGIRLRTGGNWEDGWSIKDNCGGR